MPINLSAAGSTYFAAAAQMSKLARANTDVSSVQPVPYWEQLFSALNHVDLGYGAGPASATQNVYQVFQQNLYNETYALFSLDLPDSRPAPASIRLEPILPIASITTSIRPCMRGARSPIPTTTRFRSSIGNSLAPDCWQT